MCHVYILYSERLNRFYTGITTEDPSERLRKHNDGTYGTNHYTYAGRPWKLFIEIECESLRQARGIELHIKKMKSSKFIRDLKEYPEIGERLLNKYK